MKLAAFGTAAAAMASAVSPNLLAAEPALAQEGEVQKIRTMCRACLNNCGMVAYVQDGKVIKLEGDPDDPMNKGAACAKGLAGIQALYNPNRIKYPMNRLGERGSNEWERISWEQAIDEICDVMWEWYQKEGPKSLVTSTGGGGNPQFFSPARFSCSWRCRFRCPPRDASPECARRGFARSVVQKYGNRAGAADVGEVRTVHLGRRLLGVDKEDLSGIGGRLEHSHVIGTSSGGDGGVRRLVLREK